MKERPILFKGEMVRAILDGRKTQTRRLVKPQPPDGLKSFGWTVCSSNKEDEGKAFWADEIPLPKQTHRVRCPYGQVVDRLIVASEIPGVSDNYCAGSDGIIYSRVVDRSKWKPLKSSLNGEKYGTVTLVDPKRRSYSVHALVCAAFHGQKHFKNAVVRHLDGNPLNNDPGNLRWGTYSENEADKRKHGTVASGERQGSSKLTSEDVSLIQKTVGMGLVAVSRAAEFYRVDESWIRRLVTEGWKDLPPPSVVEITHWKTVLEIEEIRVQRLQDISEEDAKAEGIESMSDTRGGLQWLAPQCGDRPPYWESFAKTAFYFLWESINGEGSWNSNPWVWVITFKVIKQ